MNLLFLGDAKPCQKRPLKLKRKICQVQIGPEKLCGTKLREGVQECVYICCLPEFWDYNRPWFWQIFFQQTPHCKQHAGSVCGLLQFFEFHPVMLLCQLFTATQNLAGSRTSQLKSIKYSLKHGWHGLLQFWIKPSRIPRSTRILKSDDRLSR